jgi:hypothetical protein
MHFRWRNTPSTFTCFSIDLGGSGDSDKPAGAYTTEVLADDVAASYKP